MITQSTNRLYDLALDKAKKEREASANKNLFLTCEVDKDDYSKAFKKGFNMKSTSDISANSGLFLSNTDQEYCNYLVDKPNKPNMEKSVKDWVNGLRSPSNQDLNFSSTKAPPKKSDPNYQSLTKTE